jgi:N-methylhydantoinase B
MTMNTVFPAIDIMNACWAALAQVDPERACASWGKCVYGISAGTKPNGKVFVMYHWHASSGGGAVKGRDGFPTTSHQMTLGGMMIPNVETYEQSYPVRIHRQELRCDAGGVGEYRGGPGVDYEADVLIGGEHLLRSEGSRKPTGAGTNGGSWGAKGSIRVTSSIDGTELPCPQYGVERVPPFRVSIEASAGGGWGDPLKRDPSLVLRDVRDGIVSVQSALSDYGVVIGADGKSIASLAASRTR